MDQLQARLRELLELQAKAPLTVRQAEELSALLSEHWVQLPDLRDPGHVDWTAMERNILQQGGGHRSRRMRFLQPAVWRAAAAVLVIGGTLAYLFTGKPSVQPLTAPVAQKTLQQDVRPGSDKAILTLSNGKRVELNAQGAETINEGKLAIRNSHGTLSYQPSSLAVFNTMTTPRGGQYKLFLPDGSRVWLNAASSITFPTAFPGASREVSVTGEVYFDVAAKAHQPFLVKTSTGTITVLGTQFNVNTYQDEPNAKISLIEGAIRIGDKVLRPDQAYLDGKVVSNNSDQDVAWKDGVFSFDKTRIDAVMRQLCRWYNIEVSYPTGVPTLLLSGSMGRDLSLQQTVQGLRALGVNASLQNNLLIVKS